MVERKSVDFNLKLKMDEMKIIENGKVILSESIGNEGVAVPHVPIYFPLIFFDDFASIETRLCVWVCVWVVREAIEITIFIKSMKRKNLNSKWIAIYQVVCDRVTVASSITHNNIAQFMWINKCVCVCVYAVWLFASAVTGRCCVHLVNEFVSQNKHKIKKKKKKRQRKTFCIHRIWHSHYLFFVYYILCRADRFACTVFRHTETAFLSKPKATIE